MSGRIQQLGQLVSRFAPPAVRERMISYYSAGRSRAKYGPRYLEHRNVLETTQWYSADEMRALQDHLLRTMTRYAATHVPYWRGLFRDLGLRPDEIRTAADLRRLPVLEKQTIRANAAAFRAEPYAGLRDVEFFRTSGTTGEALEVAVTLDCLKLEKAFTWLHRSWGGVSLGDRVAAFIGYPVVPPAQRRPPFWVHDSVENRTLFSLHHMTRENMRAYADALVKFQPKAIVGYPTAIYLMALWLLENDVRGVRPAAVFTASESLLVPYRETIEAAFGCRILDWYGATEIIGNVTQCERGGYHVKDEYGVIELLDDAGAAVAPGQSGSMICTGLNNHAMPLFRYRVGDAALEDGAACPCGRAGRLLGGITGRTEDVIVTPEGKYISRLDFIFKTIEKVREAQMIQESVHELRVRVVPASDFDAADEARIIANLRERLGDTISIRIEKVDAIPRLPSGKFRYVISKVPLGLGGAVQAGELLGVSADEESTL